MKTKEDFLVILIIIYYEKTIILLQLFNSKNICIIKFILYMDLYLSIIKKHISKYKRVNQIKIGTNCNLFDLLFF